MDQKKMAIVLSSVLVVALVGAFLMLNINIAPIYKIPSEGNFLFTEESSTTSPEVPAAAIDGWKTYQNSEFNFSASIPEDMNVVWENSAGDYGYQVRFGKKGDKEIGYGKGWEIFVYNKSEYTVEKLISEVGSQFGANRKEERENIIVNGLPGLKVVITTSTQPDWYSEIILFEKGEYTYEFSSGTPKDGNYDIFYNSFKLAE